MDKHVVNGPPMRAMKGTDEEAKTSLQSLEKKYFRHRNVRLL